MKFEKATFYENASSLTETLNTKVPAYQIPERKDGNPESTAVNALAAMPLGEGENDSTCIPFWQSLNLNASDYKNRTWKTYSHFIPLSTEIRAYKYRFTLNGKPKPDEKTVLVIPFCAFVNTIKVNGAVAAKFYEGFLPLRVDLTKYLAEGKAEIEITAENYKAAMNSSGDFIMPVGAMFKYTNGLTVPPQIEISSSCDVNDIFIKSDIKNSMLDISAQLLNASSDSKKLKVTCTIESMDGQELLKSETAKTMDPNSISALSFTIPSNGKLNEWDIGKPNLYNASFRIYSNDKLIQQRTERFGYRTVSISGENIYLNGKKIRISGPWAHIGEWSYKNTYKGKKLSPKEVYERMLASGLNYGRLHCQPFSREFYDAADEAGFLLIAEAALAHRPKTELSIEHVRNFVSYLRNHPSIIIWSGSNEFEHWIVPRPEATMEFLLKVQEEIHKLDNTRPVQHSGFGDALGKLDIYNIHYPSETLEFPRCLYWKKNPDLMTNKLYIDNYTKYNPTGKKPMIYGEHFIPGEKRNMAFFHGDDFYSLLYSDTNASENEIEKLQGENWRLRIRAAREQNVAGISPNILYTGLDSPILEVFRQESVAYGAYFKLASPVLVSPSNQVKVILFNDDKNLFTGKLTVSLRNTSSVIFTESRNVSINPDTIAEQIFKVTVPPSETDSNSTLEARLEDSKGTVVFHDVDPVKVLSSQKIPKLELKASIWGEDSAIEELAKSCGLLLEKIEDPAKLKQASSGILIICGSISVDSIKSKAGDISSFTERGGRVLILDAALSAETVPVDTRKLSSNRGSCIGFIRASSHPLMNNASWTFTDNDFKYWGDDLLLCKNVLLKADSGNFTYILDGGDDLDQVYLMEVPNGKGLYIASCLNFAARSPSGIRSFYSIIKRLSEFSNDSLKPGIYLASNQEYSCSNFLALGWKSYTPDMDLKSSTLAIDRDSISIFGIEKCIEIAAPAKNLLLLNLEENQIEKFAASLAKSTPVCKKATALKGISLLPSKTSLFNGISSHDFAWGQGLFTPSCIFAGNKDWKVSTSQGIDAVFESDGRKIVFLNLPFARDVKQQDMRNRFIAELSTNLSVAVQGKKIRNLSSESKKFIPLDMSKVLNSSRSFYMGTNCPSGRTELASVPFIFPKAESPSASSMLRFNARTGSKIDLKTITYDTPIDRFEKETPLSVEIPANNIQADSIFFAWTSTRNWKILFQNNSSSSVLKITFKFTDGTEDSVPVRFGSEIGDCRQAQSGDLRNAKLGISFQNPANGDGEVANIFVFEWRNQSPEKKLQSIIIKSESNPPYDPMIFGITVLEASNTFI